MWLYLLNAMGVQFAVAIVRLETKADSFQVDGWRRIGRKKCKKIKTRLDHSVGFAS